LTRQKAILPLLFSWILIFGIAGLGCNLHLCHTSEDGIQVPAHDRHAEEGGCCDKVSEFLQSGKELVFTSGISFSTFFLPWVPNCKSITFYRGIQAESFLYYQPPAFEEKIHILHQVFII